MPASFSKLLFHCVFAAKGRRAVLTEQLRQRIFRYMQGIWKSKKAKLLDAGGTKDHLHLLLELPTDLSVADAMRVTKGSTSKWVNKNQLSAGPFGWQDAYSVFTVSASERQRVERYIDKQEFHHRRGGLSEELAMLYDKHGIDYEEVYL